VSESTLIEGRQVHKTSHAAGLTTPRGNGATARLPEIAPSQPARTPKMLLLSVRIEVRFTAGYRTTLRKP
jgi:hypothetical protein